MVKGTEGHEALRVLLVDDEPTIRLSIGDALTDAGYSVITAADGAEALDLVANRAFDVVVSDIRLPKADGLTIFRRVRSSQPDAGVILITAYGAVEDAVAALKEGADDYLTKPFDAEELLLRVERIADRHALRRALDDARAELSKQSGAEPTTRMVGSSLAMSRLQSRIQTIARSDAPVLIVGETGSGKELVAKQLHEGSERHGAAFVVVNCAAFPETLLEAELFGHERGAFTGAVKRRDGRFKAADGGTLFLDEVAEIPPMAQAKLLRVLQEGTFEPLGTNTPIQVDVRVISATHRNLKERISQGRFREDLYYRLNVLDIIVPPLRERRGDLPELVEYFLRRLGRDGEDPPPIAPRAWAALSEFPFPGNVRELEHAVQHALVLARGEEIDLQHLPSDIAGTSDPSVSEGESLRPLAAAMKGFEREYLLRALRLATGKRTKAAEMLGISRKNLWEKLRAHGISDADLK